ncbi:hypothetical protein ACFQ0B_40490 [Nonomuraea thailandensis]
MHGLRASAVVLLTVVTTLLAPAPSVPAVAGPADPEPVSLVTLSVPDAAAMERLVASGADLTERVRPQADGSVQIDAVLTPSQLAALPAGVTRASDAPPRATAKATTTQQDQIVVERAVWFKSRDGYFLSVEASSSAAQAATLTVTWQGRRGTTGQAEMIAYMDAGAYLGHQFSTPSRPATARSGSPSPPPAAAGPRPASASGPTASGPTTTAAATRRTSSPSTCRRPSSTSASRRCTGSSPSSPT